MHLHDPNINIEVHSDRQRTNSFVIVDHKYQIRAKHIMYVPLWAPRGVRSAQK